MKHLHQNDEFRFNEVLFEHRNKEYGAYVLRNESDRILTKSLFIGVSLLAAISITPLIINAFNSTEDSNHGTEYVLPPPVDVDRPDTPPTVLPPKATVAPNVKTIDKTIPTPKAHVTNEKVIEKIEGAVDGTKNNSEGQVAPPNVYVPTTPAIGTGPITTPVQPRVIEKPKDPNAIETELSVEASFDGGMNAFRDKVMNKFDTSSFDETGDVMKTTVTFIVETNGTISAIKADGKDVSFNSEAVRVIKLIKGTWKPGKNKQGQAVRSYFKFPISMKFDN